MFWGRLADLTVQNLGKFIIDHIAEFLAVDQETWGGIDPIAVCVFLVPCKQRLGFGSVAKAGIQSRVIQPGSFGKGAQFFDDDTWITACLLYTSDAADE